MEAVSACKVHRSGERAGRAGAGRLTGAPRWLLAAGLALAIAGCGEETPAKAIYSLAHDLEHTTASSACERLYPSAEVPPAIASALSLRTGGRSVPPAGFACERALGAGGQLDSFEITEPRVRSAQAVAITPESGITAAATARVAIDGAAPVIVKLVRVEGEYRVLVDLDTGSLA